jgi:hypothetical protein
MAWGAQATASSPVLNGANTCVNISALVQKQNIEASVAQFQAGEYACRASTDYGNIANPGHHDYP